MNQKSSFALPPQLSHLAPFAWICALSALLTLASTAFADEALRLIETGPGQRSWMTERQTFEISRRAHESGHCGGYMDVTEHQDQKTLFLAPLGLYDGLIPTQQRIVEPMLKQVAPKSLLDQVTHLSNYKNRYYSSDTGVQAAHWIRDQFADLAKGRTDVTVDLFKHSFRQPSVIARIAGNGPKADEIVVIGAHEDSINSRGFFPNPDAEAPGADDDASGVATVLEAFRILMKSGYQPARTIEFMTYAGEEKGLLGSQDIAKNYQKAGKKVVAVLQLDMTMFPGKEPAISLVTDHVHRGLTDFTIKLIETYVKVPYRETKCGYACSDHASWTKAGYPSVFPFEAAMGDDNPNIHTTKDTVSNLDLVFGTHYVKLATAFAVESSAAK